jgi:hypothetical protein
VKDSTIAFEKDGKVVQGSWFLLGCFLLGPLWLAFQAMWMPALIYLLAVVFTGGIGVFIMPFAAAVLVEKWYTSQGWKETAPTQKTRKPSDPEDVSGVIFAGIGVMTIACLAFAGWLTFAI